MHQHETGAKDNISDLSTQNEQRQQLDQQISKREAFLQRCVKHSEIVIYKKKYQAGDCVLVRTNNQSELVGQILSFYAYHQEDKSIVPLVELQWYYSCTELPDSVEKEHLSDYELFLTEQTSILFIDSIQSKCYVVSMEEFESLQTTNAYFSRAKYNTQTKQLDPPMTLWKKVCNCEVPQNPDLHYIQCDRCSRWFHLQCVGLTQDQVSKLEQYICKECL